jgi:hypothetical protein
MNADGSGLVQSAMFQRTTSLQPGRPMVIGLLSFRIAMGWKYLRHDDGGNAKAAT